MQHAHQPAEACSASHHGHRHDAARVPRLQVISLGTHLIEAASAEPMLLMEVMPSVLAKRSFPAPATHEQIEPGYRDAPDPSQNCVIVFSRVCAPCLPVMAPGLSHHRMFHHRTFHNRTSWTGTSIVITARIEDSHRLHRTLFGPRR